MKPFALISLICISLGLVACGGESSSSATQSQSSPTDAAGASTPPDVQLPPGPPPKKLVVKDLKVGSGAAIKGGERILVQYVDAAYSNGKTYEVRWTGAEDPPYSFVLGTAGVAKGFQMGLKGMKVGGRRELRVPARLSFTGAKVYVIELLAIET